MTTRPRASRLTSAAALAVTVAVLDRTESATITRSAIVRLTAACALAFAVLLSVPTQHAVTVENAARTGMTIRLGTNTPLHRMSNGKIAFVDYRYSGYGQPRLDVINPNGAGRKRLTSPCPAHPRSAGCLIGGYAWSPNGSRLAWMQGTTSLRTSNAFSLFVVNADGTGETRLARCRMPGKQTVGCGRGYGFPISWSPDGSQIVFTDGWSLYSANASGGGLRRLTHCNVTFTHNSYGYISGWAKKSCYDVNPAWSPDGSKIIFVRLGAGGGLDVVNADGSGVKRLTRLRGHATNASYPTWSPDGRTLAFDAGDVTGNRIYAVDADGSHLRLLVSGPRATGPSHPAWSPDGTRIVYASNPGHPGRPGTRILYAGIPGRPEIFGPAYKLEVWVMNANGTGRRRLYRSACCTGGAGYPIWSPDGRYIAFVSDVSLRPRSRPTGIYLMDADGRHVHSLTQSISLIAWQPLP